MSFVGKRLKAELLRLTWWEAARDSRKRWCRMTMKNRKGFINLVIWISGILILFSLFCVLRFHLGCCYSQSKDVNHNEEQKRIQSVDMDYSSSIFILSSLMCGLFS